MHLSTKDLRRRKWSGSPCLILGFEFRVESFQIESGRPSATADSIREESQPRTAELARILIAFPWFGIVIALVTG